ncbi:Na/Pi cotransporter family protein [Mycobacterium manitobense]|uniref:Na/Pi cotransporter family protein n=1 Tax=[Mycobacterium] manitobense TaxID=190147 RepID=A0A9X2YV02_9MYCO|nr:Na/Pi symporter [[Mycobacterium] manitobense]MCV7173741.1 Na/Pi cotransporter family protein [[Mycobacterium] manitobense]
MDVDILKEIIAPVVGGLGIFLLGLEFMERGIQSLSVNRMRDLLGKMAGNPAKGVVAGTLITGIIQSSTAMTVMTVGLVNSGVLALRGAIGVIMGANIGTTLGNGLIALPLGPLGLLFAGIFASIYVFSKADKARAIALCGMGFALVFYGLNLMTGGLKPLREMPQVMNVISSLDAGSFVGVVSCALIAALITALIHSSSATIGIVMGLGASGVLEWKTAIAFAIGADLGTTITSWIASLNLSKNAKRTAYAHIAFNFIGVCVVLVLFFPAIQVLTWVMGFFGGDPGSPVVVDGEETFPLVPVAVGLFSIFFNIFNVLILFPFVGTFERVLMRIGHKGDDVEDYSLPKYLDRKALDDFNRAVPAMRQEVARALQGSRLFLDTARGKQTVTKTAEHSAAIDALNREIRVYSAQLFHGNRTREQMDLVASMIEEADFTGSLTESLHQIARRIQREPFSPASREVLDKGLDHLDKKLSVLEGVPDVDGLAAAAGATLVDAPEFEAMRWTVIDAEDIPAAEKGALLALLGSMERAEALIDRIAQERASVDRDQASVLAQA